MVAIEIRRFKLFVPIKNWYRGKYWWNDKNFGRN